MVSRIRIFLFLFLVSEAVTIEEGGNYAFGEFENFKLTREIFKVDINLKRNIEAHRQILKEKRKKIVRVLSKARNIDESSTPSHPINGYHLTKLSSQFYFLKLNRTTQELQLLEKIEENLKSIPKNPENTMIRIGFGMVQIYDAYQFKILRKDGETVIVLGNSTRFSTRHSLNFQDFFHFAKIAFHLRKYDVCIDMLRLYRQYDPPKMMDEEVKLRKACVTMNNKYLESKLIQAGFKFKVHPYFVDSNLNVNMDKRPQQKPLLADLTSEEGTEFKFFKACRGEVTVPRVNGLKCYLVHHFDPFLKLGPFKLEIFSQDPYIVVFRDILSEKEMGEIIKLNEPQLSSLRDQNTNKGGKLSDFRYMNKIRIVSKAIQAWFEDVSYDYNSEEEQDKIVVRDSIPYQIAEASLFKMTRRLELASNMNLTGLFSSSKYQVTNYGLGGICELHVDPRGFHEGIEIPENQSYFKNTGDYIATLMAWLDDAPLGGATAFPYIYPEVTVFPDKGSMALWFSLDKKGFRDSRTTHGGCPVLKGSKWILNKWVFYNNQFNKYKCGLVDSETISGFEGVYI